MKIKKEKEIGFILKREKDEKVAFGCIVKGRKSKQIINTFTLLFQTS